MKDFINFLFAGSKINMDEHQDPSEFPYNPNYQLNSDWSKLKSQDGKISKENFKAFLKSLRSS